MPEEAQPNVLFVMCDQLRADAIAALGNSEVWTPNMDRLVRRGAAFPQAYTTCPVCVAARYTIRTGCEPPTTGIYSNSRPDLVSGQPRGMEERCGRYLARTMRDRGYRTFGIGKFHTAPWNEDVGFDVQLHSEEMYGTPEQRRADGYAGFIGRKHPAYDWIEALMGERTEMYYMPQMSPLPADLTVEAWAADRAVEQISRGGDRPFFGFLSFVGPHPPLAPPLPFNRIYDPDRMPNPVRGDRTTDHMDEQIPWMNHAIWAEDINDSHARCLRARYYGEVTYIDWCLGRVLDAVESRHDADNTLICFFSDHGDHLGDHSAWQKESYFEASCRIPFLLSWPRRIARSGIRDDLVCLTDLFGVATGAAGTTEVREGVDVLGVLAGRATGRDRLVAAYGEPGTRHFKVMVRQRQWKYIYFSNGAGQQLFDLIADPNEISNLASRNPGRVAEMRRAAREWLARPNANRALSGDDLRGFPFEPLPRQRIHQFDTSRGAFGFPNHPRDVLEPWAARRQHPGA